MQCKEKWRKQRAVKNLLQNIQPFNRFYSKRLQNRTVSLFWSIGLHYNIRHITVICKNVWKTGQFATYGCLRGRVVNAPRCYLFTSAGGCGFDSRCYIACNLCVEFPVVFLSCSKFSLCYLVPVNLRWLISRFSCHTHK